MGDALIAQTTEQLHCLFCYPVVMANWDLLESEEWR